MEKKVFKILLIEDDSEDIDLIMEFIKTSEFQLEVQTCKEGSEALEYLVSEEVYKKNRMPDLIILDLNMPKMNGLDLLKKIKRDEVLRVIPVLVLTTSEQNEDIQSAYYYGASCYIVKPMGIERFQQIIQSIQDFWFHIVKFPPKY